MSDCNKCNANVKTVSDENEACISTGYRRVGVSVPVTVTPYAKAKGTTTTCCGDPIISPDVQPLNGDQNGSCSFSITQILCIEIPVSFGAETVVGDTYISCDDTDSDYNCDDCKKEEE